MAANKNPKKVVRLLASSGDDGTITVHVVANTQNDVNTHAEGNNGEEITIKPEELISDNQSPMEVNSSSDFVKDITDDTTAEDMISETTLPEGLCRKENQPGVWTNALIPEGKCFGPYEKNVDIGMIQPQQQTYYLPHIIRNRIYDDEQCNIQMIEDSTGENVYYRTLVNVAKDTELIALENINEEWSFTSVPNSDNIHEANCEDGVNLAVENAHPDILTDDSLVEEEDVEPNELIVPHPTESSKEIPYANTEDTPVEMMTIGGQPFPVSVVVVQNEKATLLKWNCEQCDDEFPSFRALKMHMRQDHDEDAIKDINNSLKPDHTYNSTSNKIECQCCEKSFRSKNLLTKHMRQFHQQFESYDHAAAEEKVEDLRCLICDKVFSKRRSLNSHMHVHVENKYKCDLCDKSFRMPGYLKVHRNTHTCEQCNKTYKEAKNLNDHFRNRHKTAHKCVHSEEARQRTCPYCDKHYASPHYLKEHMRLHTKKDLISCSNCPKKFINMASYSAHRCGPVDKSHRYKCMDCDEGFVHFSEYKIHKRKHDQEPLKCPLCPRMFKSRPGLRFHLSAHNGKGGEKPHVCPKCNKSFAEARELNAHFSVHTGEPISTCSTCGKSFGSGQAMHIHKLMSHTSKLPYTCQLCNKGFATKNMLRLHTRIHTNERPHICEHCGTAFRYLGVLSQHRRIHTGEKPHHCTHCERTFVDSKSMKRHLVSAHSMPRDEVGLQKPKPALCDICGRTLSSKKALKKHRLTHSNGCVICRRAKDDGLVSEETPCPHPKEPKDVVKNVPCPFCDKFFSNRNNLNGHMYIHSEVKKYKCELCDKSFGRANHLRDHQTFHTGARPYACDECGKTYKATRNLKEHIRLQHNKQHKCAHCKKTFTCTVKSFKSHQKECK